MSILLALFIKWRWQTSKCCICLVKLSILLSEQHYTVDPMYCEIIYAHTHTARIREEVSSTIGPKHGTEEEDDEMVEFDNEFVCLRCLVTIDNSTLLGRECRTVSAKYVLP